MKTLLPILILSLLLAYKTEQTTVPDIDGKRARQTDTNKLYYWLLMLTLALPVGLRTMYNDTGTYINGFNNSPSILSLLSSGDLHLLRNPAFAICTAFIRSFTSNYHIYFMIFAFFVQCSFVSSIRRLSKHFTLSIGLYICLGTYVFSFAAMKQTIAMAILMLAVPHLFHRRYFRYYLLVFVAFLFHTYAIAFVILPLFWAKPWKLRTFVMLGVTAFVLLNFEAVLGSIIDYANESGKNLSEYEVFNNTQVHTFRVLVYATVPLLSFLLRPFLFGEEYDMRYSLLTHMSIFSFAFMLLGTISGANMFARMAFYFEFGTICALPWIVYKAFEKQSSQFVKAVACVCFLIYFVYAYQFASAFDDHYRAISLYKFLFP